MNPPGLLFRSVAAAFRRVPHLRGRGRAETLLHRWFEGRGWSDVVDTNGYSLEVLLDDLLGRSVYLNGIWEPLNTSAMRSVMGPGDVAFDVGANSGYYALLLSRLAGPGGRVFAFEPVASTAALLRRNLARNGAANVDVVALALSDGDGSVHMSVSHVSNTGASHVVTLHPVEAGRLPGGVVETITAECRTGDAFWESAGRPDVRVVKADIEGHELRAVYGMRKMLATLGRAVVMLEVRDRFLRSAGGSAAELFAVLADLGYRSFEFDPRARRFVPNDALRDGELICFARQEP